MVWLSMVAPSKIFWPCSITGI
ncbi:protein of unknown function (plasmid) [Azospirillum baldaniorum]|uniref:Uncharacterized protein n=1 Tax=Azospirillum baldaniorum TaxID=1064539 RepID=A0A9P1JXU9_9PROT|nr:protein of unknown function [Azospirillum baldaniorum]